MPFPREKEIFPLEFRVIPLGRTYVKDVIPFWV
jgi:hypothetical protein